LSFRDDATRHLMKVRCPGCGKSTSLPESDAGLLALCPACGMSYQVPEPLPPSTTTAPSAEAMAAASVRAWILVGLIGAVLFTVVAAIGVTWGFHRWQAERSRAIAQANSMPAPHNQKHLVAPPTTKDAAVQPGTVVTQPPSEPVPHVEPTHEPAPVGNPAPEVVEAPALPPSVKQPAGPEARPPIVPVALETDGLTDEKIGASIKRGVDNLLSHFSRASGLLRARGDEEGINKGLDILCVYALMQCQEATSDPRLNPHDELMKDLIDAMKKIKVDKYEYETYARGLRATALALYARKEDHDVLLQDAAALMRGQRGGRYTYTEPRGMGSKTDEDEGWDNSNSQYGLLGVWSAAEEGIEVPSSYWAFVQKHWTQVQCANGQWDYNIGGGAGTHSMTCAGLASLFVTHDYLDAPRFGSDVGRDPFTPALSKGLRWLEQGDNSVNLDHGSYDLYGLERVGLASGFKYFGKHDWYRELAAITISIQQPDGSWGDDINTAYCLLFLSRGRHPILMNKLRFEGNWANHPRDVANLARFSGYQLERPLNWQVVGLTRNWTDWMDSPVLYLASHKAPVLSTASYDKMRSFVENGGLLFMQADGGSADFDRFAHEAAAKLFPAYPMIDLPPTHPLCNVMFKIKPTPSMKIVSNGSRILMMYSNADWSKFWQLRDEKRTPLPFQFGTNLFVYAAGKRDLRNRLVSTYIPEITATPSATFTIARLKYAGNWDPEPAAWTRFSRWFHLQTGYGLDVTAVNIRDLKPGVAPIAQLTGTSQYELTSEEAKALRDYVEAGGVLLVDMCGGTGSFDKGLQSSFYFASFPNNPARVMSASHPMLAGSAAGTSDLAKPILRQFAIDALGVHAGMPEEIAAGKGHVIYTSLDITSGLLGTDTWGVLGYEPTYAQELVKNVILWTVDGQHEEQPVANR
jgi:hypothetical protein